MDLRIFCLFFIIFCVQNGVADMMAKNLNNYGPYIVEWEHFDSCPSTKSVIVSNTTSVLIKEADNTFRGLVNLTLSDNVKIEEIKMAVYTMKDGKKTQLWNYIINKPCQHYMLAAMMETYFPVKNCALKKGFYSADLPLTSLMVKYLGNSFFYGDYIFKVAVNSKHSNIGCFMFDPSFKKKTAR